MGKHKRKCSADSDKKGKKGKDSGSSSPSTTTVSSESRQKREKKRDRMRKDGESKTEKKSKSSSSTDDSYLKAKRAFKAAKEKKRKKDADEEKEKKKKADKKEKKREEEKEKEKNRRNGNDKKEKKAEKDRDKEDKKAGKKTVCDSDDGASDEAQPEKKRRRHRKRVVSHGHRVPRDSNSSSGSTTESDETEGSDSEKTEKKEKAKDNSDRTTRKNKKKKSQKSKGPPPPPESPPTGFDTNLFTLWGARVSSGRLQKPADVRINLSIFSIIVNDSDIYCLKRPPPPNLLSPGRQCLEFYCKVGAATNIRTFLSSATAHKDNLACNKRNYGMAPTQHTWILIAHDRFAILRTTLMHLYAEIVVEDAAKSGEALEYSILDGTAHCNKKGRTATVQYDIGTLLHNDNREHLYSISLKMSQNGRTLFREFLESNNVSPAALQKPPETRWIQN